MLPVDPLVLLAFVPAGLALNLTPGADMMFCLGQGLKRGRRAAMAANLGIAARRHGPCGAGRAWAGGAGRGASGGLRGDPLARRRLSAVAGGSGPARRPCRAGTASRAASPPRVFRQALMVNLLNPKVILFILAFLPQFVDPARPVLPQFVMLGLVFNLGGLIVNGAVALFAGVHRPAARAVRWAGALAGPDQRRDLRRAGAAAGGDGTGVDGMTRIDETLPFLPVRIAVLTVSDTRTPEGPLGRHAGRAADRGGASAGRPRHRPRRPRRHRGAAAAWIADPEIDVILTTGGTGLTGRDVTRGSPPRGLRERDRGLRDRLHHGLDAEDRHQRRAKPRHRRASRAAPTCSPCPAAPAPAATPGTRS